MMPTMMEPICLQNRLVLVKLLDMRFLCQENLLRGDGILGMVLNRVSMKFLAMCNMRQERFTMM